MQGLAWEGEGGSSEVSPAGLPHPSPQWSCSPVWKALSQIVCSMHPCPGVPSISGQAPVCSDPHPTPAGPQERRLLCLGITDFLLFWSLPTAAASSLPPGLQGQHERGRQTPAPVTVDPPDPREMLQAWQSRGVIALLSINIRVNYMKLMGAIYGSKMIDYQKQHCMFVQFSLILWILGSLPNFPKALY